MIFNVKIIQISNTGTPSRILSPNGQTPPTPHHPAIFCLKVATLAARYIYIYITYIILAGKTGVARVTLGSKNLTIFTRDGQIFSGGFVFLIFSPKNVKYRKLLWVKLLFSCELSKSDPSPYFEILFQMGSTTALGGRNPPTPLPRQFSPW